MEKMDGMPSMTVFRKRGGKLGKNLYGAQSVLRGKCEGKREFVTKLKLLKCPCS